MQMNKISLAEDLERLFRPLKLVIVDPILEIRRGVREKSLPLVEALGVGVVLSQLHYWGLFGVLFQHFEIRIVPPALFAGIFGSYLVVCGVHAWGLRQIGLRRRLQDKLNKSFLEADLKTKLGEFPLFLFDVPVGSTSRKLRLRSRGITLSRYRAAKESLESGLNIGITKIESPNNNKELIDILYSLEPMPDYWELVHLGKYQDYSFPVGKTRDYEITASLQKIPHYLVAGETSSGKSTFIRSMVMVLIQNNPDLKVVFIDLKGKMDGQFFDGLEQVQVLSELPEIETKLAELSSAMDTRMNAAQKAKAENIREYNRKQSTASAKWGRFLIVVDEIAELMPSIRSADKAKLGKIQSLINRFSRLGRATGFHLVIGVQKPDHKNLDPTVKANLPGIVCFPVSHFTQSVLVLGNGHAAELNAEKVGRGIWKHGSHEVEIQAPFLTNDEIEKARERIGKYFHPKKSTMRKEKADDAPADAAPPSAYEARS